MMILYGSTLSPFVRKAMAFCLEKGLAPVIEPVGLGSADPAFRAISPFGKMPGFRDGDFTLCDSTAIVTYVEARYPEPSLIPADPKDRARTIWFDEMADTVLNACGAKLFFNRFVAQRILKRPGDAAVADAAEADELPRILDYLETVIADSGFLVADRLTLADLSVASPFANLRYVGYSVDAARWPRLAGYVDRMLARPSMAGIIEHDTRIVAAMGGPVLENFAA